MLFAACAFLHTTNVNKLLCDLQVYFAAADEVIVNNPVPVFSQTKKKRLTTGSYPVQDFRLRQLQRNLAVKKILQRLHHLKQILVPH